MASSTCSVRACRILPEPTRPPRNTWRRSRSSPTAAIDSTVSLKLSQLGLTVDRAACVENLMMVLQRAAELGVGVEVDMEQSELVDASLEVFRQAVASYPETRLAIQVCLRRTVLDLESLAPFKPRIRLVKGAYAEPIELALRG